MLNITFCHNFVRQLVAAGAPPAEIKDEKRVESADQKI